MKKKQHFYYISGPARCYPCRRRKDLLWSERDALGGVAKNLVRHEVMRPGSSTLLKDVDSFVDTSRALTTTGRQYFTVLPDDIAQLSLPRRYPVKGTQKLHHTRVVNGRLEVRDNSCFCTTCASPSSPSPCQNALLFLD